MKKFLFALLLATIAGCSSTPQRPAKEAKKPAAEKPELLTGRVAFQKLYISARNWAPDAKPYRLESEPTKEAPGADGKAGVWRGYFASVSRRSIKFFVWSGLSSPDAPPRGVSPATEDTFNPSNTSTQPFDFGFLKIDSDKAYEVAQAHGGKKITDKTPDQPLRYEVEWVAPKNELIWHVVYGTSDADAKLRIAVDATTGDFLRVEK